MVRPSIALLTLPLCQAVEPTSTNRHRDKEEEPPAPKRIATIQPSTPQGPISSDIKEAIEQIRAAYDGLQKSRENEFDVWVTGWPDGSFPPHGLADVLTRRSDSGNPAPR